MRGDLIFLVTTSFISVLINEFYCILSAARSRAIVIVVIPCIISLIVLTPTVIIVDIGCTSSFIIFIKVSSLIIFADILADRTWSAMRSPWLLIPFDISVVILLVLAGLSVPLSRGALWWPLLYLFVVFRSQSGEIFWSWFPLLRLFGIRCLIFPISRVFIGTLAVTFASSGLWGRIFAPDVIPISRDKFISGFRRLFLLLETIVSPSVLRCLPFAGRFYVFWFLRVLCSLCRWFFAVFAFTFNRFHFRIAINKYNQ